MVELISLIAKSLVKQPDAVSVTMVQKGNIEVYELHVAPPEDMGKVIGKQGRIAKAIRSVVKAAAIKENKKISVDIV
nr:KH domain-containing protein [Veillonella denticariosi]